MTDCLCMYIAARISTNAFVAKSRRSVHRKYLGGHCRGRRRLPAARDFPLPPAGGAGGRHCTVHGDAGRFGGEAGRAGFRVAGAECVAGCWHNVRPCASSHVSLGLAARAGWLRGCRFESAPRIRGRRICLPELMVTGSVLEQAVRARLKGTGGCCCCCGGGW